MIYLFSLLALLKLTLDYRRNQLMATNQDAVAVLTTAVNDTVKALQDLATKVGAAPADVSGQITTLAQSLTDAVKAAGEPVTGA